jgi:hypothetical protein
MLPALGRIAPGSVDSQAGGLTMKRRAGKGRLQEQGSADKFRVVVVGEIEGESQSGISALVFRGAHPLKIQLPEAYAPELLTPLNLEHATGRPLWAFRAHIYEVSGAFGMSDEEISLRLKYHVFTGDRELQRMRRDLEALDNLERLPSARREKIPEAVRLFVWQRDRGQCVTCGSTVRLEFDHIIPLADGGSNTERNIQLLCESCNRTKGRSVV